MPFVAQIGDAVQTFAEVRFQWKVHNFFSLSDKVDDYYDSPDFIFADSRWHLRLYPNGETHSSVEEWASLYLWRVDILPPKTISYTLGILCSDGRIEEVAEEEEDFSFQCVTWGDEFWPRSKLRDQASRLMPDNILTITCRLKCSEPNPVKVSVSSRMWEVSLALKRMLDDGKWADFTLKVGDRQWPVHRAILETRSEYFANMFGHDWAENTAGEATFEDIEGCALDVVLTYLYSNHVEDQLCDQNVCDVYIASHKFLLDDLRALCVWYMKRNMCTEMVCKVLVIAKVYCDAELNRMAIEFFTEEADQVFDSEEWKELKRNHPSIVAELLEETTKRERRKRQAIERD